LNKGYSYLYGETRSFSRSIPPELERSGLISSKEFRKLVGDLNGIWSPYKEGLENWIFPEDDTLAQFMYMWCTFFLYVPLRDYAQAHWLLPPRGKRDKKLNDSIAYLEQFNARWSKEHQTVDEDSSSTMKEQQQLLRFEMGWDENQWGSLISKQNRRIVITFRERDD